MFATRLSAETAQPAPHQSVRALPRGAETLPRSVSAPARSSQSAPLRSAQLTFEARRSLGALISLIDEPNLRDILLRVHAGRGEVWVDAHGTLRHLPEWELAPEVLRSLAIAIVSAGGRQLDELHPCVDVHLGGGIRVHAILSPISVGGPVISIRLPRSVIPTFESLVSGGLCDEFTVNRLRRAVHERKNLLIVGQTGAGKTTLLAALLGLVSGDERILSIEDLAELQIRHPHHVALEARPANSEGAGALTVDRLLREALRMRPDRIVLGECRGAEIATLLTALNTGHEGGAGTLHANRLEDVPARLEALGLMAGLSPEALARQAVSALDMIVHLERGSDGRPRVTRLGRFELQHDRLVVAE